MTIIPQVTITSTCNSNGSIKKGAIINLSLGEGVGVG